VSKADIFGDGSGFVLHELLSAAECQSIIAQAEAAGMRSVNDDGYDARIRVNHKVTMAAAGLGAVLFERARPFFAVEPIRVSNRGDASEPGVAWAPAGAYVPYGVNPTIRVCRYTPGGHFQTHRDGGHDVSASPYNASLKTFMVYLNDGFTGGATSFYRPEQPCYAPAQPELRVHSYMPRRGDCLVFNSHHVHDGGTLLTGTKYILRTELMYRPALPGEGGGGADPVP
jgi:hypothetical protein